MQQDNSDTAPQTPTAPESPKWTAYSSCHELPFPIFIDCLLEQQYEKLILSGQPTEDELGEHWLKLYSEFHLLSGNSSMDAIVMQLWLRDTIRAKILSVKSLLLLFGEHPVETIAGCIRAFGFQLPPVDADINAVTAHINRIMAQLKGLEHEANQVQHILDSLKSDEMSRQTFTKQLVAVSRHYKFHISMKDITTAEYCEYVRSYRHEVESINNAGHGTTD